MTINTYLSIITLNVNGLNAPIKKHRFRMDKKKKKTSTCSLQESHFRPKDMCRLKVRGTEAFIMQMDVKRKLE